MDTLSPITIITLVVICYSIPCMLVGWWGESRKLGFWLAFGIAFIASPLLGALIVWQWDKIK